MIVKKVVIFSHVFSTYRFVGNFQQIDAKYIIIKTSKRRFRMIGGYNAISDEKFQVLRTGGSHDGIDHLGVRG